MPLSPAFQASALSTFVTVGAQSALPNSRRLAEGSNITITDNGAGSTVVFAASGGGGGGAATSKIIGLTGINNATTPNSQYDLDSAIIQFTNGAGESIVLPGEPITCDVSVAGPALNGRDQAGAFSASSWVHFWWISNGTLVKTIASTEAPPGVPDLTGLTGYTHWAYAGAVRFDGSSVLLKTYMRDNFAFYQNRIKGLALNAGSATSETAVDISAIIPPNCTNFVSEVQTSVADAAPDTDSNALIRLVTGVNYFVIQTGRSQVSSIQRHDTCQATFPNVGQNLYYLWDTSGRELSLIINGYCVSN